MVIFFCNTNTNISSSSFLGCPERIYHPDSAPLLTGWVTDSISFIKGGSGLMWKGRWNQWTGGGFWTIFVWKEMNFAKFVYVCHGTCTPVSRSWFLEPTTPLPWTVWTKNIMCSIWQLEFHLLVCELLGGEQVSSMFSWFLNYILLIPGRPQTLGSYEIHKVKTILKITQRHYLPF